MYEKLRVHNLPHGLEIKEQIFQTQSHLTWFATLVEPDAGDTGLVDISKVLVNSKLVRFAAKYVERIRRTN